MLRYAPCLHTPNKSLGELSTTFIFQTCLGFLDHGLSFGQAQRAERELPQALRLLNYQRLSREGCCNNRRTLVPTGVTSKALPSILVLWCLINQGISIVVNTCIGGAGLPAKECEPFRAGHSFYGTFRTCTACVSSCIRTRVGLSPGFFSEFGILLDATWGYPIANAADTLHGSDSVAIHWVPVPRA